MWFGGVRLGVSRLVSALPGGKKGRVLSFCSHRLRKGKSPFNAVRELQTWAHYFGFCFQFSGFQTSHFSADGTEGCGTHSLQPEITGSDGERQCLSFFLFSGGVFRRKKKLTWKASSWKKMYMRAYDMYDLLWKATGEMDFLRLSRPSGPGKAQCKKVDKE